MGWLGRLFGRSSAPGPATPLPVLPQPAPPPASTTSSRSYGGFAVIDVETTGLSPRHDRVVSIAVVLTNPWGEVEHEWSTLVNPLGPVGATHIHGITDADVASAPTFDRLAQDVLALVRDRAVVAHNARFDLAFLTNELARTGWHWPSGAPSLCTLEESFYFQPHLDRRRLADCCWAAGVHLTDAHSALGDARAAAQLFSAFVRTSPSAPIDRGYDRLLRTAVATPWPNQPGVPVVFPVAPPSRQRSAPVQRNVAAAARTRSTPPLLEAFTLSDALDEGAPSRHSRTWKR